MPDPGAVRLPVAAVSGGGVGAPVLRLRSRGLAAPAGTHLVAQVVDVTSGRVVGRQVRPVPVRLDGSVRRVRVELEAPALRLSGEDRLRVEVGAATGVFGPQRSHGVVEVLDARVSLPTS